MKIIEQKDLEGNGGESRKKKISKTNITNILM
jgi:hypothetical protein